MCAPRAPAPAGACPTCGWRRLPATSWPIWNVLAAASAEVFLDGYGKGGQGVAAPLTSEADLRDLLAQTAQAGQFPDGDKGPVELGGLRAADPWPVDARRLRFGS